MLKRLLLLAAMGIALVACNNPSTPGSSVDDLGSPAMTDPVLPSASDMLEVSPSP